MFHQYRKIAYLLVAVTVLGLLLLITPGVADAMLSGRPSGMMPIPHISYRFVTLNNNADPTFNQLLGINNGGEIAGYFGSGTAVNGKLHPNKGYVLNPPYAQQNYVDENFPGSTQTQVTSINEDRYTAGFWVDRKGNNFGFVEWDGGFTSFSDPHTGISGGVQVNQLLGINKEGTAVGFYTDSNGNDHAYTLNQDTGKFTEISASSIPGAASAMATGINNAGDVVGTYSSKKSSDL